MSDLANLYRNKVSLTLTLTLVALTVLGVFALSIGLWSAWYARPAIAACPQLAEQGEFIGGHLAAAAGMLTLAIVIYTGFTQSQQQQRFFMRRYFLQGVEMIERGFQIGDRLHAFRLIDYFARLAQSERDDELFLILNTGLPEQFARRSKAQMKVRATTTRLRWALLATSAVSKKRWPWLEKESANVMRRHEALGRIYRLRCRLCRDARCRCSNRVHATRLVLRTEKE